MDYLVQGTVIINIIIFIKITLDQIHQVFINYRQVRGKNNIFFDEIKFVQGLL